MPASLLPLESAQPSLPLVVLPVPPQHLVDLVDQSARPLQVTLLPGLPRQPQKVADGEGVGPQVSIRGTLRGQPRPFGEGSHVSDGFFEV
jgi:hypothetical protein